MGELLRTTLGSVVAFVVIAPAAVHAADDRAAIDAIVKPFLKDKPYLGLVVGITRPGSQQFWGFGQVTLKGKGQIPASDTIFEIGSITKVFTGTLLADKVLTGALRLDDPVQKYLPEGLTVPRRDDRDISLLHLATHTSSLPVQPPFIGLFALAANNVANPYGKYDPKLLKKSLVGIKLSRPIGSQFEYSNLGVGLLGHALVHAAKAKSYQDLLLERLAKPLNLSDTRLQLSAEQSQRLAPGHTDEGKPTSAWTFACLEGCGGLRSTPRDLITFVDAGLGRRQTPLTKAFRMAQQPWRELSRKDEFVGLCWLRQKLPKGNQTMLWHNGGTGGYRSFLGLLPQKSVGVVVLSNSAHFVDDLGRAILQHLDKGD